jgi:hypothetical protein
MLKQLLFGAATMLALPVYALDGDILIHDPSTIVADGGRYYTYGTGNGIPILSSDDGWTWRRSGSLMSAVPGGKAGPEVLARGGNNTWAPDVIPIGDIVGTSPHANYDVSPDGKSFVAVRRSPAARIMVIQNLPALMRRLQGGRPRTP